MPPVLETRAVFTSMSSMLNRETAVATAFG
jgi:hypothetical protein